MHHQSIFISLIVLFLIIGCTKEQAIHFGELPNCIQSQIDHDSEKKILTIRTQVINDNYHYWINTNAISLDGTEDIVDSNCKVVCMICGRCLKAQCLTDYSESKWQVIPFRIIF